MKRNVDKQPIDARRLRRIPAEGFSWIDRRFVREGFVDSLPPEAILLYFFLVAVSDARGLSFYADPTVSAKLKLNAQELSQARARLTSAELILYDYPIYQVLPLPAAKVKEPSKPAAFSRGGDPISLGEILQRAMEKTQGSGRQTRREIS